MVNLPPVNHPTYQTTLTGKPVEKLTRLEVSRCQHNKFIVDESMAEVVCGLCERKLNPIWCLVQYTRGEGRIRSHLEYLEQRVKKTQDKLRCKCRKCGQMTSIIR